MSSQNLVRVKLSLVEILSSLNGDGTYSESLEKWCQLRREALHVKIAAFQKKKFVVVGFEVSEMEYHFTYHLSLPEAEAEANRLRQSEHFCFCKLLTVPNNTEVKLAYAH